MDSDGFVIVKRGNKQRKEKNPERIERACSSAEKIVKNVLKKKQKLESSLWFDGVAKSVKNVLAQGERCTLQCLGVGGIGTSGSAQYQCAFALCLNENITRAQNSSVVIYDPVLQEEEKSALLQLGFSLEKSDDTSDDSFEVLYMPHCPSGLYHNVLRDRWNVPRLRRTVIIGNLFSNYHLRLPKHVSPLIHMTESFVQEKLLEKFEDEPGAFNDTAILSFEEVDEIPVIDLSIHHNDKETIE